MKTNIQIIKNMQGKPEYVLLPISAYEKVKYDIEKDLQIIDEQKEYIDFDPKNFIKNPLALARMKAKITQKKLAEKLHTSQAYISKIENDNYCVSEKLLHKVLSVLKK